jgi:outer membrane receptor protein involved in Fe transport
VAAAAFLVPASGVALAQEAPAPAPAASESDEAEDDIIVVAEPGDQVRIDRRTYTIRDDATAQSTDMYEVLGRVPSVSVSPAGEVTLLGAGDVVIQINGQPVPGQNLEQILRGIPGSQVERIEIITNPSAQYSAQASGGIINIITRQRFEGGLNGSVQAGADSLGGYHLGLAPSWSRGPWSLSAQVGVYSGGQDQSLVRERQDLPAGPLLTEEGDREISWDGWYASRLQAGYRPDEQHRFTAAFDFGNFNSGFDQSSDLFSAGTPTSSRVSATDNSGENNQFTFEWQRNGDQPRELFKLNVALNQFQNTSNSIYAITPVLGVASEYRAVTDQENNSADIKLDFESPRANESFLTYGLNFNFNDQEINNVLDIVSGPGPAPYDALLEGRQQTLAGYATYQFETGDWTWLPGLRGESYRREVVSGLAETDTVDDRLFPSLHIRRALSSNLNLDVSYSSRIQRPGIQQLDPALRFIDVNRAASGNPNLEPTTTDAYEANLVYQANGASFSLTFFDRISQDIVSNFLEENGDGVIVSMPVNAGESEQRGLQALLRGPLGERWRYSVSGNVLSREFDYLSGGTLQRREEMEYDGVFQLDYRDPDQNAVGADQLQFELRFQGPRYGLQTEVEPFYMANFTYRRKLTDRLYGVFMAHDLFDSIDQITEVNTADYYERTEYQSPGTRFRIALTYQFGDGPQRPPQDQQQGGPPPIPQ